jgi:hypothetical protein
MMKRMNLIVDEEALESARKRFGSKTYSDTVNHALREMVRGEEVLEGLKWMNEQGDSLWWPGYRETYRPDRLPEEIADKPWPKNVPNPYAPKKQPARKPKR